MNCKREKTIPVISLLCALTLILFACTPNVYVGSPEAGDNEETIQGVAVDIVKESIGAELCATQKVTDISEVELLSDEVAVEADEVISENRDETSGTQPDESTMNNDGQYVSESIQKMGTEPVEQPVAEQNEDCVEVVERMDVDLSEELLEAEPIVCDEQNTEGQDVVEVDSEQRTDPDVPVCVGIAEHSVDYIDTSVEANEEISSLCVEQGQSTLAGDVSAATASLMIAPYGGVEKDSLTYIDTKASGAYTRDGDYVYFGSYPQTLVTASATITALNSAAGTLPTANNSQSWTDCGFYIAGEVAHYMWYKDVTYSGTKYRGVYFINYRPTELSLESGAANSHQDDNGYVTSKAYWFAFEPIKWRIIATSGSVATLLCETILDSREYRTSTSDYSEWSVFNNSDVRVAAYSTARYQTSQRTEGGQKYVDIKEGGTTVVSYNLKDYKVSETTYSPDNYEKSTLRNWLNSTFYSLAFDSTQKSIIQDTTVSLSLSNTGFSSQTKGTATSVSDKVYLLSYSEVTSGTYFSSAAQRRKTVSAYARSQGCYVSWDGGGNWWLRSMVSSNSWRVVATSDSGAEYYDHSATATYVGIVPVVRIQL